MQLGELSAELSRVCGQNGSSPREPWHLPLVHPEKHLQGEPGRKDAVVCTFLGLGFFVCLFGFGSVLGFFALVSQG